MNFIWMHRCIFTSILARSVHEFEWSIKTNDTPHCIICMLAAADGFSSSIFHTHKHRFYKIECNASA